MPDVMRLLRVFVVIAGLLTAAPLSFAAQVSTPFIASATVARGCTISATNLVFGAYPAIAGATTVMGTSTITVTCAVGDTYTVGLDSGLNGGGGQEPPRRMARATAPVDFLNYELFRDAARTQYWGDNGQTRVTATGSGLAQSHTVFGRLPGAQVVRVGAYIDTVTVTVRN